MIRNLLLSKKIGVFLVVFALILICSATVNGATINSASNGNWSSPSTWGGGLIPTSGDDVNMKHVVTIDVGTSYTVNSVYIDNGSKLTVFGSLITNKDLSTHTNGDFSLASGSVVIVKGNVTCGNNTQLSLSSYFIVFGNLSIQNGGQSALNILNAHVYVLGTVTSSNPSFTAPCDTYNGTTNNPSSTCDAGNFQALITNETNNANPVISGTVQQAITQITSSVPYLSPVSSYLCVGGSASLNIGESRIVDLLKWYQGTTLLSTQSYPSTPYTYSANQAGSYNALYKIGNAWYQTNSVAITVASPSFGGTISGGASPLCLGSNTGIMTVSGIIGTILKWERQINSGGWNNTGSSGVSFSETPASAGTWEYRVAIQSGTCPVAYSAIHSIVVNPIPVIGSFN